MTKFRYFEYQNFARSGLNRFYSFSLKKLNIRTNWPCFGYFGTRVYQYRKYKRNQFFGCVRDFDDHIWFLLTLTLKWRRSRCIGKLLSDSVWISDLNLHIFLRPGYFRIRWQAQNLISKHFKNTLDICIKNGFQSSSNFQTPRRELKVRRVVRGFWRALKNEINYRQIDILLQTDGILLNIFSCFQY